MEKKICSYETLFAVSGNLAEDETTALVEKFVTLIKENATDVTVNEWGKRRFAYPINYVTEGYYVLVTFKSEPSFPLELERVFGITEGEGSAGRLLCYCHGAAVYGSAWRQQGKLACLQCGTCSNGKFSDGKNSNR